MPESLKQSFKESSEADVGNDMQSRSSVLSIDCTEKLQDAVTRKRLLWL